MTLINKILLVLVVVLAGLIPGVAVNEVLQRHNSGESNIPLKWYLYYTTVYVGTGFFIAKELDKVESKEEKSYKK